MAQKRPAAKISTITAHRPPRLPALNVIAAGWTTGRVPRWGGKKICRRARNWWPASDPFWKPWSVRICRRNPFRRTWTTCGCWAGRSSAISIKPPSLRKVAVERLLADLVEDGGLLLYHSDSEEQQRSFESTCRKFWRFLTQSAR